MPINAESKIVKYIEVEYGMFISETWGMKNNGKMLVPEYNILIQGKLRLPSGVLCLINKIIQEWTQMGAQGQFS